MSDFYRGKRVVVTGGAGFVGSHLCEQLIEAGARVVIIDNYSRGLNLIKSAEQIRIDIERLPPSPFDGVFAVFNLAASVAGVIYNQAHQVEMFDQNIRLLTVPILKAEMTRVPHFLQMSSICVYAPDKQSPAREDDIGGDPIGANAGYSWAKRMGEHAAHWSNLPHVVIARPTNIFGPRDYFDDKAHVIPALIRKCIEQQTIEVHGTGREIREFIYVEDVARGLMAALEHGKHQTAYNVGTHGETQISIAELVALIQEMTGTLHKRVVYNGGDAGDPARWSDTSRLNALGWKSRVDLVDGLRETIEWYMRETVIV